MKKYYFIILFSCNLNSMEENKVIEIKQSYVREIIIPNRILNKAIEEIKSSLTLSQVDKAMHNLKSLCKKYNQNYQDLIKKELNQLNGETLEDLCNKRKDFLHKTINRMSKDPHFVPDWFYITKWN